MPTVFSIVKRPCAIRQSMKAGSNYTGVAPADGGTPLDPALEDDIFKYAPGTAGGLFEIKSLQTIPLAFEAWRLVGFGFIGGGQSSWKLELKDADGNTVTLLTGTTEATYSARIKDIDTLVLHGSQLALTTVAASTAMTAWVVLAPWNCYCY